MALELNGTTGVSLVQDGVITDANLPAGSVLQVVSTSWSAYESTTSSTLVATGRSVSITPTSTSSKIVIFVSTGTFWNLTGEQGYGNLAIYRNGSSISSGSLDIHALEAAGSTDSNYTKMVNFSLIDSPSSTSAITYELYASTTVGTFYYSDVRIENSIIAMEIAG